MADDVRTLSRFVRPIYDAIDNRQYRAAIKLCGHKKVAHLDIVQVLKAHCLERTGRQDDALEIVRAVQRNRPTDETLLNTMYLVFRLCGCEDEMVPTYEHACSVTAPPNEELFTSLFAAYARQGEFLKQQQTALKMSKAFGKLKYMCWAAQSMMLQVQHGGAPPKMLALADKMLLKTMRDAQSDDGEALQLLVEILRRQDRHEDALQAFDEFAPIMQSSAAAAKQPPAPHFHDGHACSHSHGPTARGRAAEGEGAFEEDIAPGPLQAIDRLALEAELAAAVQQWERSAGVYETLLSSYNADDWTYLRAFIDARLQQKPKAFDELLAFLETLAAKESNALLRGPWLAMVHVHSERVRQSPLDAAAEDALVRQMSAYADRFYSKTCCFSDLRQYLALVSDAAVVSPATKTRVVQLFSDMAQEPLLRQDSGDAKAARNQLNRRLLALKALRFLGAYDAKAPSELEALVQSLVAEYEASSWLNVGAQGGQREVQHTDDLLLLAAHTLLALAQRPGLGARRASLLTEAAALLEYGLAKSAYNFQMKLLLAQVYSLLGAGDAMLARHQELDVKHIQLDSLSFLVLDKLLQLGQLPAARRLCESIRRLHSGTDSDTPEYITRAYRLGVFSKVRDMTSFLHERMRPSQTLAIARGELLQFELQDALAAGGSARLAEVAASERLQNAVNELENMLASERGLSANQHREVIVQWDSEPLLRPGDAFGDDDAPLVNVDRSATMETSRRWLSLQLVAPKLLRALAGATDDGSALQSLAEEYVAHVAALGLSNSSGNGDVTARVWQWSCDVVALATLQPHASDAAERECVTRLAALQAALPSIRDDLCALLAPPKLTSRGLAAASLLLRDAGLWSGLVLCALLRAWTKRRGQSKKEDASATALRALLKHVQELLAAVELHVQALDLAKDAAPRDVLSTASEELLAAQQTALENVHRSHRNAQTQLSELLRTATTSIRMGTQK